MNQYTLFTNVQTYYENLIAELETAQKNISFAFLSFVYGEWGNKIANVLIKKAQAGVCVRLILDEIGEVWDEQKNLFNNIRLVHELRAKGIQVEIFRPTAPLKINNRLHCKFVAIDNETVYIGGSNIADSYITWVDANLKVQGKFGNTFHDLYDFIFGFSKNGNKEHRKLNVSNLKIGADCLFLTVPRQRYDVRQAFINLISEADKFIYIRTWSFLPDEEILNLLCNQAKKGVQVNILFSHRTRFRPLDYANYIHVHQLVEAGANVYRYVGNYMHTKVAWNNHDDILFGSANLESHSLRHNFETCLQINASSLTSELNHTFCNDLTSSVQQTAQSHLKRSFARKLLTHVCSLATVWL
jgi:cardiolipin synthase